MMYDCYSRILCKIVRTSPPITVFFSSYTMAFIAIDRHRFIVHSAKRQVKSLLKIYLLNRSVVISVIIQGLLKIDRSCIISVTLAKDLCINGRNTPKIQFFEITPGLDGGGFFGPYSFIILKSSY